MNKNVNVKILFGKQKQSWNGVEWMNEYTRLQTCAWTSASLKRMNQLTEKRPEFWRVKALLLLSQMSRRDALRRESWDDRTWGTVLIPWTAQKSKRLNWLWDRHTVTHGHLPRKTLPEVQRVFCLLLPPVQMKSHWLVLRAGVLELLIIYRTLSYTQNEIHVTEPFKTYKDIETNSPSRRKTVWEAVARIHAGVWWAGKRVEQEHRLRPNLLQNIQTTSERPQPPYQTHPCKEKQRNKYSIFKSVLTQKWNMIENTELNHLILFYTMKVDGDQLQN